MLVRTRCCMALVVFFTVAMHASQPHWDENLDFTAIERRLVHEAVISSIPITTFLKKTGKVVKGDDTIQLITLESGLKAVFKPGEYAFAERAAYKASKLMGLRLVPPTIMRVISGEVGSLQFFVESSIDLLKGSNKDTFFRKLDPKDVSDMTLFYFVFGQWDLHAGNQIITQHRGKTYLALIDNAGMLHKQHITYGDFAFICKGENAAVPSLQTPRFPFKQVITIHPGPLEKLLSLFRPFISEKHIEKLWSRHKPITYVFWKDAFWMQMYKYNPSAKPLKTKQYYRSTLEALKRLDRPSLQEVWSDGRKTDECYFDELIDLILERRDQVIADAEKHVPQLR